MQVAKVIGPVAGGARSLRWRVPRHKMARTMVPLGLIAGEGVFPLLVARGARAAGRRVVCTAFDGFAWDALKDECDEFHWVGVLRVGQWARVLRRAGVEE